MAATRTMLALLMLCALWARADALGQQDAIAYCNSLGWTVNTAQATNALICTAPGVSWGSNCNSCTSWRLVVWVDGGYDSASGGQTYYTLAGHYYGAHNPCRVGWNLPHCGTWTSAPPTPAPPTPAPTPQPTSQYGVSQQDAITYCTNLGWTVNTAQATNALICTAPGVSWGSNCNSCTSWRLVVWVDGGYDSASGGQTYYTLAGHYYGAHNPCRVGWNLPHCGTWASGTPTPATPVPPTPMPTPQPPAISGLSQQDAITYCNNLGWTVNTAQATNALICTAPGVSWGSNCNSCTSWRLVVWVDGGYDSASGGQTYYTLAGHYYGAHNPCRVGWNLPHCGTWSSGTPVPATPAPPTPAPTPVPPTPAPTPNPDAVYGLTQQDAIAYCNNLGWTVNTAQATNALICTAPGVSWGANCNSCTSWRLVVWVDGGYDSASGGQTYQTLAGHYYGAHNPCRVGWNLPHCGTWVSAPPTPAPPTPAPTPNPDSVYGLTLQDASTYCTDLGWTVNTAQATNALICTAPGVSWGSNCNSCTSWRLVVWVDGGYDSASGGQTYQTLAGHYYGAHNPCRVGWNLPHCGEWTTSAPTPVPSGAPPVPTPTPPTPAPPTPDPATCRGACLIRACATTGELHDFTVKGVVSPLVWGSAPFTDDSDVGAAAVHAGKLAIGETKPLTARCAGPQPSFTGSESNGVTSETFAEPWPRTFSFDLSGETLAPPPPLPKTCYHEPCMLNKCTIQGSSLNMTVIGQLGQGSAWGSRFYTDDSSVGLAAVHSGLLQPGEVGSITVTCTGAQESYTGSMNNGVTTQSYGAYPYSFELLAGPPTPPPATVNQCTGACVQDLCAVGTTHRIRVTGTLVGRGWGTGLYTDDTTVAMASVHAGIVQNGETKEITVTCEEGPSTYLGSTQNSVTTESYGSWPKAFSVGAAPSPTHTECVDACLHNRCTIKGTVHYITLTGTTTGGIWGTSIYSDDSAVATAAVHAGLIAPGQTQSMHAVCMGAQTSYEGTESEGVTSLSYGAWPYSYTLESL